MAAYTSAQVTLNADGLNQYTDRGKKVRRGRISLAASYSTGGDLYDPTVFNLTRLDSLTVNNISTDGAVFVVNDPANLKLLVLTAINTQAGAASNQSTHSVEFTAIGV